MHLNFMYQDSWIDEETYFEKKQLKMSKNEQLSF